MFVEITVILHLHNKALKQTAASIQNLLQQLLFPILAPSQRELSAKLTEGVPTPYQILPPALRATSLGEGGKPGGEISGTGLLNRRRQRVEFRHVMINAKS